MKKFINTEDVSEIDYQVKAEELVEEILFLRQYGVPTNIEQTTHTSNEDYVL